MSFSKKAKELREISGLSQMQLSKKLGISAAAIGFLENSNNEPKGSTVVAYAKHFDVTTDYLLGLENDYGARVSTTTVTPMNDDYSVQERKIIEQYRSLPEQLKKLVRDQLDIYSGSDELSKHTVKK